MGIRALLVSSVSQIRQSAAKNTLANASPASSSQCAALRRCGIDSGTLLPDASVLPCPTGGKVKITVTIDYLEVTTGKAVRGVYSSPCSIFSWQVMQCLAQGTASSRFCCSSSWQFAQTP